MAFYLYRMTRSNKDRWLEKRKMHRERMRSEDIYTRLVKGDRVALSEGITLVESTKPSDEAEAQKLIELCMPHSGNSVRIGITGVPGVGKSTFIETFGKHLIAERSKIAVLAVDPTSSVSKGSILGDKTRLQQVLFNLLSNAIKFTNNDGVVTLHIKYKQDKNVMCISVEDSGIGISEEEIDNIFAMYYQVDREEVSASSGTGIGLAISKILTDNLKNKFVCKHFKNIKLLEVNFDRLVHNNDTVFVKGSNGTGLYKFCKNLEKKCCKSSTRTEFPLNQDRSLNSQPDTACLSSL